MNNIIFFGSDLQSEKDLQVDSQLKGVEEEIAKKDFVEEQKISQLPTEEIGEVLFDADETIQSEDDKERLKEHELAESLADEDEETDLDAESILNEQSKYVPEDYLTELKLKEAKLKTNKDKARKGLKASKKLKANQNLQRSVTFYS